MQFDANRCVLPVVEFCPIEYEPSRRGGRWEFLPIKGSEYVQGVRRALDAANGIYLFYDSRGRALYAGKAVGQSLLAEMTSAYNRDRGDLQTVRLVWHPEGNSKYRSYEEKIRQPVRTDVQLHEIAHYFSAYQVEPVEMIPMFEALIVRAFANDLLNKRMEKF